MTSLYQRDDDRRRPSSGRTESDKAPVQEPVREEQLEGTLLAPTVPAGAAFSSHQPVLYASEKSCIPFFRCDDEFSISLDYQIVKPRFGRGRRGEAVLTGKNLKNGQEFEVTLAIPKDCKVGSELEANEQKLYRFMLALVRLEEQRRKSSTAEDFVQKGESALLLDLPPVDLSPEELNIAGVSPEAIQQLIVAVTAITKVTSLTYEGFLAAQAAEKNVRPDTETATTLDQPKERGLHAAVMPNVVGLMKAQFKSGMKIREMQLLVLDHLEHVNAVASSVSASDAQQIVERVVPNYMKYLKAGTPKSSSSIECPDLISHAISSAIFGGFGGAIVTSLVVDPLVHIIYPHYSFPGWQVGAGLYFAAPFVLYPLALVKDRSRKRRLAKEAHTFPNLSLVPHPGNQEAFAAYAEKFRNAGRS